jgi:glycosyltransferase involved in cell wall biosynthesis
LGGHGSVAFSLIDAAENAGRWSHHLVFVGIEPLLEEYENKCAAIQIPFHYVSTVQGQPWRSWWALYRVLAEVNPDFILLHSVKTILPCWLAAALQGIPLIAVEHQHNALKKKSEWLVSRLLMKLAKAVVILTPEYRDDLRRKLNTAYRSQKVHVIPNGIDVSAFAPRTAASADEGNSVMIGMAARFSSSKQQRSLVKALKRLRSVSRLDWRLTLAGDGETLAGVRALVKKESLEAYVEFPGFLGQEELIDWFGRLDVYAHASDGETLSTSLLQAMAMRLPIVASDVVGISNLLSSGEGCGLLVKEASEEGFADAFLSLADDSELADKLAVEARRLAVSRYSQEAMFAEYNRVMLECAK